MNRGGKTCWKALQVEGPGEGRALDAGERLAALYRFQNGERTGGLRFVREGHGAHVTDPAEVDWDAFPVLAALEAVTRDELRRLRSLLHADAGALTDEPTPEAWGLDPKAACAPEPPATDL